MKHRMRERLIFSGILVAIIAPITIAGNRCSTYIEQQGGFRNLILQEAKELKELKREIDKL